MQIQPCSDPDHLHLYDMKVKLEIPAKQAMAQSRSLPRSASELADPPSPFSSNPAHHPAVSMPTTPAGASSSSSFGCIAARPATDSPPPTPSRARSSSSKPTTPAAAAAAYYASLWSPRRLMQRAARAFRSSRSRRFRVVRDAAGEEHRASSPTSRVSDKASADASVVCAGGATATEIVGGDGHGDGAGIGQQQQEEERHDHHEVVPEKIIHEMNHHAPPVVVTGEDDECGTKTTLAEEKETTPAAAAAAAAVEEDVEPPKKGAALTTPEHAPEAAAAAEEVADKFVTAVKKAIREHEEEQGEKKQGAAGKFQLGSRVKTAMEARSESEQPRRREVARSNDVIEEARSKLLEKRQCSRVRALVGAFETVMEDAASAAGTPRNATPRHGSRKSA